MLGYIFLDMVGGDSFPIFLSYSAWLEGYTSRFADLDSLLTFATRSYWDGYLQPKNTGILIHLRIFALTSLGSGCVQNC